MNTKELKKLYREREKIREQRAELDRRNDENEKDIAELENVDIVALVREVGLIPETLATLLKQLKDTPVTALRKANTEEDDEEN